MRTLTEEQQIEVNNKEKYIKQKSKLLQAYKSYAVELEGAESNFEEELIIEKREKLAVEIKSLSAKLREIEQLETVV